jgi:hypothetical protein
MVSTLLVLAVAVSALGLAWSLLRKGRFDIRNGQDWEEKKHDIDVQVVRALLEHNEERYLRRSLTPRQFKVFYRRRIRLTLRMLRLVEENAGMLIRMGQLARLKRDVQLTRQADELVATAIQFRWNLFLARPCLYLQWLMPFGSLPSAALGVRYRYLLDSLASVQQCGCQLLKL